MQRPQEIIWNREKDHFKVVTMSKIYNQWIHMRFQDFKSLADYNSELYKIAAQFEMCSEQLSKESKLEKTLSIFHILYYNKCIVHAVLHNILI